MTKTLNFVEPSDVNIRGIWAMDDHLLLSTEPAIDGKVTIAYDGYSRQTDGPTHTLCEVADNPTYRDLWVIASMLIAESKDEMHVFIEDFHYDEDNEVWVLVTGS